MDQEQFCKSRLKPLKLYPERYSMLHFYEEVFWRAFLGNEAFSLYRVFCALLGRDESDQGFVTVAPGYAGFSLELLGDVLGKPHTILSEDWQRLEDEGLIIVWQDRHGRSRLHIEQPLPILTPLQVATLNQALRDHHQRMFYAYLRVDAFNPDAIIQFVMEYEVEGMYEYWERCTDATFVPEFDSWASVERLEVAEEEKVAAVRAEIERRQMVRSELTQWDKNVVLDRDDRVCRYCGGAATTVDHIIPVIQGGGNEWTNLAAACGPCNSKKGGRTPDQAEMVLRPLLD